MTSTLPPGPIMLDLLGPDLLPEDADRLKSPAAGGVILFARNYETPERLQKLVADIRAARPELIIAVDQEGGRVQRFREGFTRLPAAARYAAAAPDDLADAADLARTAGWLMAAELRAVDVDFSFAPVLDVEGGVSRVIGDRAFGTDAETVTELAGAFAEGMRRAGMAAVGKHFPGHGFVAADSHLELPVDSRSYAEVEARDLVPFKALIAAGLEGVMPAHVIYSQMDSRTAGFSPFWIGELLRGRLGFKGLVFSDDLSMAGAAVAGDCVDRVRAVLGAGCDMGLVCNAPESADQVLDAFRNVSPDPERTARIEAMRGRFPIDRTALMASAEWQDAAARIADLQ